MAEESLSASVTKAAIVLGKPLDQPERLKCACGCDHFKINLEAPYDGTAASVINSVECETCHEIYALSVEAPAARTPVQEVDR